jgi:uncharacterized protein YbaR (Trm112 family)
MTVCPYCKKQFAAKEMEIELIEGVDEGGVRLGKVAYSCPHCHVFLSVGESAQGPGGQNPFMMGMQNMMGSG